MSDFPHSEDGIDATIRMKQLHQRQQQQMQNVLPRHKAPIPERFQEETDSNGNWL